METTLGPSGTGEQQNSKETGGPWCRRPSFPAECNATEVSTKAKYVTTRNMPIHTFD